MPRAHRAEITALALLLVASASLAQVDPLSSDTVGPSPRSVAPPGSYAFSVDGDVNLGGFVFKEGYPFLHNDGGVKASNTAVGLNALVSATPGVPSENSGTYNTASGASALRYNTTGRDNAASGALALQYNTTGVNNTANGSHALQYNTTGFNIAASGYAALRNNTTGYRNTASGARALQHSTTGKHNVALGFGAGYFNMTGSNNVWIANYGADESHTLRIGYGTGTGNFQQNRAFISGIANATGGTFGQVVCVDNSTDQLGPCAPSSARFKEDIADLEADSEALFDLRPVSFRYKPEFVGREEEQPFQYGLIAEEVAEIYPQLVTYDTEGKPMTVRYDLLTPLLLNELKKQRTELTSQRAEIERLRTRQSELHELAARLARLEAIEATREPPASVARR